MVRLVGEISGISVPWGMMRLVRGKTCPRCGASTLFPWLGGRFRCSECGLEFIMVFQHGAVVPVPVGTYGR